MVEFQLGCHVSGECGPRILIHQEKLSKGNKLFPSSNYYNASVYSLYFLLFFILWKLCDLCFIHLNPLDLILPYIFHEELKVLMLNYSISVKKSRSEEDLYILHLAITPAPIIHMILRNKLKLIKLINYIKIVK